MQLNQFCGAGILGREAAKRASGRSTFLKVSLLTDDPIAVSSVWFMRLKFIHER